MAISDYKITAEDIAKYGCVSLPDTLRGDPQENKSKFDRLVRECVANAVNAVIDHMVLVENEAQNWADAEALRVQAEAARVAAENLRVQAENAREDAETARAAAETARVLAENLRAEAETARENAENAREAAEQSREAAESAREGAESARVAAENARESAEASRRAGENARNVWEAYSEGKAYVPGNKVSFNGSSYVCTVATTGHAPTDTAYWLLIAQKGADGKGAGDMMAATYDPKGRAQDVFQYADTKAADEVAAHDAAADAHSALFAKKQDKIKGAKGKYVGFTAKDTVGEVDAPASGGSRITLTFASNFVGQAWTLSGGGETYSGTVDSSKTATVSVLGIDTTYTLSAALSGTTYTAEVTTKAYYTALGVTLEKFQSTITVTVDSGSTVTATLGSTVLTKTSNGTAVFSVGKAGTWAIKATKGDQTAEGTVSITASGQSKALTLSYANVFGVCWDTSNSSTALTRLTPSTDPYGLVTRSVTTEPVPAVGTGSGSSPFDSYAPWSGMKERIVDTNGVPQAWKGESGFSRGTRNVMVFIPEFYVAAKRNGTKQYFYVSDKSKSGMTKHPGSGKYIGRYVGVNGGAQSVTGARPQVDYTRANFRSAVKTSQPKFRLYDFATYCAIICLYIVEFADWNSQSKIGAGFTGANSAVATGTTDSMVYHTGRMGAGNQNTCQYRWIENLWGNVRQWVDGFNANGTTAYYCTEPSKYADDTATGYTNIGTLPSSGYIKDLIVTDNGLLIPKTTGGSETTYIPDYMWSSSGWRVLCVGGYWSDGAFAGLLCFDAGFASSGSFSGVSARLLCEA